MAKNQISEVVIHKSGLTALVSCDQAKSKAEASNILRILHSLQHAFK